MLLIFQQLKFPLIQFLSRFDLTDYLTLNKIHTVWLEEIKKQNEKNNSNPEIILVGTKCDLKKDLLCVSELKNLSYDYFETSSKNNIGIKSSEWISIPIIHCIEPR